MWEKNENTSNHTAVLNSGADSQVENVLQTSGAKAGVNAGVKISFSNADKLIDLEGVDVGVGGGGISAYWQIGGGAGMNFSKTKEGKSITELELNAGFGFGGGIGGQFSDTDIEVWNDGQGPERLQFQNESIMYKD